MSKYPFATVNTKRGRIENNVDIQNWIIEEVDKRGWSYNELARRADLAPSTVSMVLSRQRRPGEHFCKGIARAFNVPVETVFRYAGILKPIPDLDANAEAMLHLFRNLPLDEQDRVLTIMRALSTMHDTVADDANGSNDTRGE